MHCLLGLAHHFLAIHPLEGRKPSFRMNPPHRIAGCFPPLLIIYLLPGISFPNQSFLFLPDVQTRRRHNVLAPNNLPRCPDYWLDSASCQVHHNFLCRGNAITYECPGTRCLYLRHFFFYQVNLSVMLIAYGKINQFPIIIRKHAYFQIPDIRAVLLASVTASPSKAEACTIKIDRLALQVFLSEVKGYSNVGKLPSLDY